MAVRHYKRSPVHVCRPVHRNPNGGLWGNDHRGALSRIAEITRIPPNPLRRLLACGLVNPKDPRDLQRAAALYRSVFGQSRSVLVSEVEAVFREKP